MTRLLWLAALWSASCMLWGWWIVQYAHASMSVI